MDADFFRNSPFRLPQWRSDRVLQLVSQRNGPLRPQRYDDRIVRTYRYFLLEYLAAGTDEGKQQAVIAEWPHMYWAHVMQFGPDREQHDILEARLLTKEPLDMIAERLSVDEGAVELYEKSHFDVRDRLEARDWISKVVLQVSTLMWPNHRDITPDEQRGLLYKYFANFGGPLALEALVTGMAHTPMPQSLDDPGAWLDDTLAQVTRSRAATAAFMEINQQNVVRFLKLAFRVRETDKKSKAADPFTQADREQEAAEILTALEPYADLYKSLEADMDGSGDPIDPVKPRTGPRSSPTTRQTMAEIELGTSLFDPTPETETHSVGEPVPERLASKNDQGGGLSISHIFVSSLRWHGFASYRFRGGIALCAVGEEFAWVGQRRDAARGMFAGGL